MNKDLQTILNFVQSSGQLSDEEKAAILKAAKAADKELEITSFKLDRTEKVKKTTAILLEETIGELEHKRKAVEAQNRELEIEAALERVRSRSLAMHKSNELREVVGVVFDKLNELDFGLEKGAAIISIFLEGTKDRIQWIADPHQSYPVFFKIPYSTYSIPSDIANAKENGTEFFSKLYPFEEKNNYFNYLFEHSDYKHLPDDVKMMILESKHYGFSIALEKNSAILIPATAGKLVTGNNIEILKRFARVFEQSYTRFLDLQKAEAQSREAQIQLALERVRAVAMSMKEPADMLEICSTICHQLQALDVKEIRNVQTAIFYEDKGTYMNYEYYAKHNKTIITETSFTNHKMHREFAAQMLKGKGEFFTTHISKAELPDWVAYQKTTNVFIDTYLETASSVSYYWHSLGPVALGISTYEPLKEEETNLFRRFLKVFELSYTRYLDIEQAIAQAREAQIQLALERARTQSMIMQHSAELDDTLRVFHEQVLQLNIPSAFSFLWLPDEEKDRHIFWAAWAENNSTVFKSKAIHYSLDRNEPATAQCLIDWKSNEPVVAYHVPPPSVKDYFAAWSELIAGVEELKPENFSDGLYYVEAFMKYGCFGVMVKNTLPEDEKKILNRFAVEFERAYTRFLDLQKAEEQAREAQVEAALERVRSRSLAMHKSDEIIEVARTVFEKLNDLAIEVNTAFIIIFKEGSRDSEWWLINRDDQQYARIYVKYTDLIIFRDQFEAKEQGKELFSATYHSEEKKELFRYLFTQTDFKYAPPERQKFILESEAISISMAMTNKIAIQITRHNESAFSHEDNEIVKRFSKVFDQSYTRFLDLQKAEAQAKEAQIQLALERVRARTMAMQKSDELSETAYILFQQFRQLGDIPIQITIGIFNEEKNTIEFRITGFDGSGSQIDQAFNMRIDKATLLKKLYEAWKEQKPSTVIELTGQELVDWVNYRNSVAGNFFPTTEKISLDDRRFVSAAFFAKGSISFSKSGPIESETISILERFAGVFDQTYTRFLDLQNAEAQARESQIQLALERVRARTMAMQKSDELADVAGLLFKQVNDLGIKTWTTGFNVWSEDNNFYTDYITSPQGGFVQPYTIDATSLPVSIKLSNAKKNGDEFYVNYEEGESLAETYRGLIKFAKEQFALILESGFEFPTHQYEHFVFGSKVSLMFITYEAVPEAYDIFKRFGKVFEQTYTRFLDLQKAEAQAREAQIEAALEKVRSRSLAMHKSDELEGVVSVVFEKLRELNVVFDGGVGIIIFTEGSKDSIIWVASPDHFSTASCQNLPYEEANFMNNPILSDMWIAREKGIDFYIKSYSFEEKNIYFKYLFRHNDYNHLSADVRDWLLATESYTHSVALARNSAVVVNSWIGKLLSENDNEILKRFARVFEQAYIRFLDLQKAEAQAKEAQIETALEKVRSRTLAMQSSDELAETSCVLFKQLIQLGIEPNRLYIAILQDDVGLAEFWITDEDGSKVSAAYTANLDNDPSLSKMYEGWKQQKRSLVIDMQGEELENYFRYLTSLNVPFKSGLAQKRRIQYIAYFSKGFIGMASPEEQPEATMQLLERFAYVFNLTFTRFNDLKIAEAHAVQAEQDLVEIKAAKKKAEDALTELKATQTQLIQSEKMASLGELTAGIAHEIQNPLNFVNNFSEVNKELLAEMNEEIEKGNLNEVKAIARDVADNQEKINHHGKRADAIVKGMLQHSRTSTGQKELTDINTLTDEYLRLAYHGLRAKDKSFNTDFKTDFDNNIGKINIIPQDIGRVLLNLINNAFYAVNEKRKFEGKEFKPEVSIQTKKANPPSGAGGIEISVKDNGNGIPQNIVDKIFQPFFTTKPTGQGTGLGLSLSYDIIKAHGGEIKVETKEGEGSEFVVQLPNV